MIPGIDNFYDDTRGDTFRGEYEYTIKDDGVPIVLTGARVRIMFRDKRGTLLKSIEDGAGITITDDTGGKFKIDTFKIDMPAGLIYYDLEITDSAGLTDTWLKGCWNIKPDITYGY